MTKSNTGALEYVRRYFPHYRHDGDVQKFIVPIQPQYHDILFPDYSPPQGRLFQAQNSAGNAIKLAYLCHAPTNSINSGDVLLFYRTTDEKAVTSIGVVDKFKVLQDAAEIASLVSRRTVYSQDEIETMAVKQTKVILFRLVAHLPNPVNYSQLQKDCEIAGPIQSIRKVQDGQFSKVLHVARR